MAKLLNRFKEEQLAARKSKDNDKASLLTTILGEIQRSPIKATSDDDVEKIIRAWIKKVLKDVEENPFEGQEKTIEILKFVEDEYLPKVNKLNHQEIRNLVKHSGLNNKRDVMQFLSSYEKEHNVVIDKKYASSLV